MKKDLDLKSILTAIQSESVHRKITPPRNLKSEASRKESLLNDILESELDLKKGICKWVQWVVSVYLIFIALILITLTFKIGNLESEVIIALLTTTTINILGLPWLIIRSLFPPSKTKN